MADANVSQLEINGTTYDICDATARDSLSQYLPLTGGTISGNLLVESAISTNTLHVYNPNSTGHIETNKLTLWADTANANYAGLYFKSFNENNQVNRNEPFIRCYGAGNSESSGGDAVVIGNGGLTVVGSGESPTALYDYYQNEGTYVPNSETLLLTSDNNMFFITGANTIDNRRVLRMTSSGGLYFNAWKADITKADNDITDRYSHSYCVVDKNNLFLSWLETHAETDGTVDLVCKARNYGTGSAVSHGFALGVGNDGTRVTNFDDPASWLEGLKLKPKTYTGTLTSGYVGKCAGWQIGYHCHIDIDMRNTTSGITTRTWTTIARFPVHPSAQVDGGSGFIWDSGTWRNMETRIDSNGDLKVWVDGTVGTNAQILFSVDFISTTLPS